VARQKLPRGKEISRMASWPDTFEETLLEYLKLTDDLRLDADVPLGDLGLDSLGVVGLIMELEGRFSFSFPEEQVTPATFYSAGSLWAAVEPHLSRAEPTPVRVDGC
jgi:acyl carrier protein